MITITDIVNKMLKTVKLCCHPVGSIYVSSKATSPAELFGGTWKAIEDVFLYCAGPKHAAGETGGAETHTLTLDESVPHTHTATTSSAGDHTHSRGSMNIWGDFTACDMGGREYPTGAFYQTQDYGKAVGGGSSGEDIRVAFSADRNWTGVTSTNGAHTHTLMTSSSGGGKAFSIMPPWRAVYAWERTA